MTIQNLVGFDNLFMARGFGLAAGCIVVLFNLHSPIAPTAMSEDPTPSQTLLGVEYRPGQ